MDFLEHGIYGKNFAMLGLGDIVIPGKCQPHPQGYLSLSIYEVRRQQILLGSGAEFRQILTGIISVI